MSKKQLTGSVAIVTGAANGLGKAIATGLAERGAFVTIADIDETRGNEVVDELVSKDCRADFIKLDLRKEADVIAMVESVVSKHSKIDILVNNAGVGKAAPFWETPTEVWDNTMAINLRGTFLCTKHVVPHMIAKTSGRIINISSAVGKQGQPLMAAYCATKAGQISLTVALAKEVADFGINVNAVCPGPVETSWWNENRALLSQALNVSESEVVNWMTEQRQIIKKALKPSDIAGVVCWLTSEDTRMITGQAISIDGGHEFPTY
jgi:NAD(P)-dependent dehydrogenase (short-subunit alcohol dehydrogenase family)